MGIAVGDKALTREERFWRRVDKTDGCWMWLGGRGTNYGIFRSPDGKHTSAHRVAYEFLVGPITEGLVVDHLCGETFCVNPAHLEPVTASENRRRQSARKTHCKRGHALDGENLYVDNRGHRSCVRCRRATSTAWTREKRRAQRCPLPE